MKDFQVVSITEPLSDTDVEVVISSFAELYNAVTSKHRQRMQLNLICRPERVSTILDFSAVHKVEEPIQLVPYNMERQKDQLPLTSTVLVIPTVQKVGKLTREALSKNIPVISYLNDSVSEYIDQTCGVFVRKRGFGFDVEEFYKVLNMLYFDPEVRKLMHVGAKNKYLQISGGITKRRTPLRSSTRKIKTY